MKNKVTLRFGIIALLIILIGSFLAHRLIPRHRYIKDIKESLAQAKQLQKEGKNQVALGVYDDIMERMKSSGDMSYAGAVVCGMANAHLNLGMAFNKPDDYKRAIDLFTKGLDVYDQKGFPANYAAINNSIGISYGNLAKIEEPEENLQKAIDAYFKAYGTYEVLNDIQGCGEVLNNLGVVYNTLSKIKDREKNLELAAQTFQKSIMSQSKTNDKTYYVAALNNMAFVLIDLAKTKDRVKNLAYAVSLFEQELILLDPDKYPEQNQMVKKNLEETKRMLKQS